MRSVRTLLAAAGILSAIASGPSGPGAQTLYRNPSGPITAFAQDGSLLAWFSPGTHRCNAVHVVSLTGARATLPKLSSSNVTCRWNAAAGPTQLAVASGAGAALWTLHELGQVALDYVVGADVAQPRERRFSQVAHTSGGAGLWLGGIAGDGSTLVYAVTDVAYVDRVACLSGGPCELRIVGGAVHRIVGRSDAVVPGAGPAVAVAAAAGRIAFVPARALGAHGLPLPSPNAPVEVRDARTGSFVADVQPQGTPVGLALAPHVLALLERDGPTTRVAWYSPLDGAPLGGVRVPPRTSAHLTASDRLVVYRVGRAVYGIDVATGRVRKLVETAAAPIGLSLEGSRLAWAENVRGRGRIRALLVAGPG